MDYLIDVIKFLKKNSFHWDEWKLSSMLTIDDQIKSELIDYDNNNELHLQFEDLDKRSVDIYESKIGDKIKVSFELPRNNDIFVAKDVGDLINKTSILSKVSNYIVYSADFVSWRDNIEDNSQVYAYEKICEFISLCLKNDILEHHHSVNKLFLFYSNTKLIVPCDFNARSLTYDVGKDFDRIIQKFNSDIHKSDRAHMLRSSLYKILNNCNESKRLHHLVSKSSNFVKLFEQDYDLFISQFCFDTEKDKIFESKREFLSKLSQLLSGIQGKLLAIPLSLVLILGQMKTKPEDSPLLINSLILLSSIVFTVIMLVLLFSQLTAISAIRQEVKAKKSRFELELADLYGDVKEAFDSVLKQCMYNTFFIWFMLAIVVVGLSGTVITYIMLTPEVKNLSLPFYEYITTKFDWVLKISSWSSDVVKINI